MSTNGARSSKRNASRAKNPRPRRKWKAEEFLHVLKESALVSEACRAVGIERSTAYRARDTDAEFAAAWDEIEAEATEQLEKVAYQRAAEGSDRLVEFILKARRPEKYRERISIDDDRAERERKRFEQMEDSELDSQLTGIENVTPIRKAS